MADEVHASDYQTSDEPGYDEITNIDVIADTGISKHIDNVFSLFSTEQPFDVSNCNQLTFTSLPDSVMLKIFSNLNHPELSRVALVCKHWLWVVYDTTLWKFLDLSQNNKVDENRIIRLLQYRLSPLVNSLDLSNCSYSPTIFKELRDCQNLNTLVLHNFALKEQGETEETTSENQLETLSIPDNLVRLDIRNVSEGYRFMHVILEGNDMSSLECFGFGNKYYCPVFTDFQTMFGKMNSLRIFECIECDTFTDVEMNVIADQLKVLEALDLRKCVNITGQSLPYLVDNLSCLTSLNLAETGVTDLSIMHTEWELSKIEEIDLSFCDFISSVGLVDSLHRMKNLKFLVLHGTGKGKANCGEALEPIKTEGLWENMEVLSLHFSIRLFEQAFSFLHHCSNIGRLSLRTCNRFSFGYIATTLKYFPNLTGLECGSLFAPKENSDKWENIIFSIAENCKNMKNVIIVKCSQIPISKRSECQKRLIQAFNKCTKLSDIVILFTDKTVVEMMRESVMNSQFPYIHVDTKASFSIIPPFKHSLDSEINQQKFKKYFGY